MKFRLFSTIATFSLASASLGCPTPTPATDAAANVDAALPFADAPSGNDAHVDGGVDAFRGSSLGTCAAPRDVNLTLDAPLTVVGNTTRGPRGGLDLVNCGSSSPLSRPPQDVLALHVPGTGMTAISFDLTMGTDADFDTVVQVRTACTEAPEDPTTTCFDNADMSVQSAGAFAAMGGSTVYLVITGFDGSIAEGAYSVTFSSIDNAPPTLTTASTRRINNTRLEIRGDGGDPDSNAVGFEVQYLDATGAVIDGASGPGPFQIDFDAAHRELTFSALATQALAEVDPAQAHAASLRISTIDEFGATSAARTVMIEDRLEVGYGEACDATHFCADPNVCFAGICQATMEVRTACGAATTIPLEVPTTTATVAHQSATLPAGGGLFVGGCAGEGSERLFNVTVPSAAVDLIVTALLPSTMMSLDTTVYIRSTCGNPASEVACNDDAAEGDLRSYAEYRNAAPGNYTVFIDTYASDAAARTAHFDVTLRPVLAHGAACDPMGIANRCVGDPCPATGAALCP